MHAKRPFIRLLLITLAPAGAALATDDIVCPGHWEQVASEGPPGRNRHSMAYDEERERVVLFGGYQDHGGNRLGDTWTWDGKQWRQAARTGPSARTRPWPTTPSGSG